MLAGNRGRSLRMFALVALASTLSSCGDDSSSPTTPIPPQPTPIGWYKQSSNTSYGLLSVKFVTANKGVAVGVGGILRVTIDGGRTWFPPSAPTTDRLNAVAFGDTSTGVAVGLDGTALRTTDGGLTWSRPAAPIRDVLNAVTFTSPTAVRRFVSLVGDEQAADLLGTTVVAAIGPVTAAAALELGIQPTVVADAYTVEGLVRALVTHFTALEAVR